MLLSLDGLVMEWALGSSGGLSYSQFGARLRDLQVMCMQCVNEHDLKNFAGFNFKQIGARLRDLQVRCGVC